jgi:hypothetical protein
MDLTLTTPALLFPALSLLLLAYTNRFLALANLIRELHRRYQTEPNPGVVGQLANLRRRVHIIRDMQALGIASLFCCVLCMFLLFAKQMIAGEVVFGVALVLMLLSLALSFWEIVISVNALDLQLQDMEWPHRAMSD